MKEDTQASWNTPPEPEASSDPRVSTETGEESFGAGWARLFFARVDIASIAVFRMMFGAILFWEAWRFFADDRIYWYYIEPDFYFKYFGCEWVTPWGGEGMYWHCFGLLVVSAFVCVGFLYRLSAILLFLGFTYVFLLDQTQYLNHHYLVCLIALLMCFIPAHRARSVDARLRPKLYSETAPAWALWLLRTQLGLVYVYAAIAKLHPDWLQGEPMRLWLGERTGFPIVGPSFEVEWVVYAFAYGGLLLDMFVVPFLLWARTRGIAFGFSVAFHFMNHVLFDIGIFPFFMTAATLLFFSPDWPRRLRLFFSVHDADPAEHLPATRWTPLRCLGASLLVLYLAFQFLNPLRHHLYPGDVHWTEEGHRFSWRMKLRDKWGRAEFRVVDPQRDLNLVVHPLEYLNERQASKMAKRNDMVLQFAHFLAEEYTENGRRPEVRARVHVSLNGRREQLIIDPDVDLGRMPRTLWHNPWILPLDEPLGGVEFDVEVADDESEPEHP